MTPSETPPIRTVIDLNPILRQRRQSSCDHPSLLLDETLADLECESCGKQVNPYWFIGQLMAEWDEYSKRVQEHEDAMQKQHEQSIAMMNHHAERLQRDIDTLEAKKRQLMNERVNGEPLGKQVKRWRRR